MWGCKLFNSEELRTEFYANLIPRYFGQSYEKIK